MTNDAGKDSVSIAGSGVAIGVEVGSGEGDGLGKDDAFSTVKNIVEELFIENPQENNLL